jgi:hypothetical protein
MHAGKYTELTSTVCTAVEPEKALVESDADRIHEAPHSERRLGRQPPLPADVSERHQTWFNTAMQINRPTSPRNPASERPKHSADYPGRAHLHLPF